MAKLTTKDEAQSRWKICESCDHLRKFVNQCAKCGCFMPAKIRLESAQCPIGKW